LVETLENMEIKLISVDYDKEMVSQFQGCCQQLSTVKNFPKNPTRLCDWCVYQKYCQSNGEIDYMILDKEE
jgi:hypothetical protein